MKNSRFFSKKNHSGFTLIEMLAFLFVFSVITVSFYAAWTTGTRYIILAKNRLIANALANEKMEVVRNLAFEDVALATSVPPGNLSQNEDVARNGLTFHVFTQIRNEDDPYDGLYPYDTIGGFVDYKYVKITVSWEGGNQSVTTSSRFVPAGIEQPSTGLGILVVNVTSDKNQNALVPQSNVRVRNADTGLDETHSTDNFGRLMLVGLAESIGKYQITLTKNDYETVVTLPPYDETPFFPVHEHASVITGAINTINMFQNELTNFTLKTTDYLENTAPNINFNLKGGQKIGTDIVDSDIAIYNLDEAGQTGSNGIKDYGKISPGLYEFNLLESGYLIIGINPVESFSEINPNIASFYLEHGSTEELVVNISPNNTTALLVKVKSDNSPVSGSEVHLTNASGYDATIITGDDGMAFFPNAEDPLFSDGTYDLAVTAPNHNDYSGQVTIDANNLKEEIVLLTGS